MKSPRYNSVEKLEMRTAPRKTLWRMVPRATRPTEGRSRYLKLAAAGLLCITLALLVPHVGQETSHRALPGFTEDVYPARNPGSLFRHKQAASAPDKAEQDRMMADAEMQQPRHENMKHEATILDMVDYLLKIRNSKTQSKKLTKSELNFDPNKKTIDDKGLLFQYYTESHAEISKGNCYGKNSAQLLAELQGAQLRYRQNWKDALNFYQKLVQTYALFYIVKKNTGGKLYKFEPAGMSGFYLESKEKAGKFIQKKFLIAGPVHKIKTKQVNKSGYKTVSEIRELSNGAVYAKPLKGIKKGGVWAFPGLDNDAYEIKLYTVPVHGR